MSFDALTHLDFPELDAQRQQLVENARIAGVTGWTIAATEPHHWPRVIRVAQETGGIPLLGIHPWWAHTIPTASMEGLMDQLSQQVRAGIGEIGLDYAVAKSQAERDHQKTLLRMQLKVARALNVPVALHCVRAHSDLLHLLKTEGLPKAKGFMHGWVGATQFVKPAVQLGLFISFGPSLLNPQRKKIRDSLLEVPLTHLCLETDTPQWPQDDQNPTPPIDLILVAKEVARLRRLPFLQIWETCGQNATGLWRSMTS